MVLFVGDKPSPRMKPGVKPFADAACERRLGFWKAALLGCNEPSMTINRSQRHFKAIAYYHLGPVVALGNEASRALDQLGVSHFKLPHPSGRNRQINDKAFISKKLEECKRYIEKHAKV
jgi:hypothetical protein